MSVVKTSILPLLLASFFMCYFTSILNGLHRQKVMFVVIDIIEARVENLTNKSSWFGIVS